jgi:hypothetical protein
MSIDRFVSRNWFAVTLLVSHTLLIAAAAVIEINDAWNDMNPTFLVMLGIYYIDIPLRFVLEPLINTADGPANYLAALMVLGGAFWFVVGTAVTYIVRAAKRAVGC